MTNERTGEKSGADLEDISESPIKSKSLYSFFQLFIQVVQINCFYLKQLSLA